MPNRPDLCPLLGLLLLLSACGGLPAPGDPSAAVTSSFRPQALTSGGVYKLESACSPSSPKVLTVSDPNRPSQDQGAGAQLWDDLNAPNQQWKLDLQNDGTYTLTAQHSGQVLDALGWGQTEASPVGQWPGNGGGNQHWVVTDLGNGFSKLNPAHAPRLALDLAGAGTANGSTVQLWGDNGTCAQQWKLVPAGGSTAPTPQAPGGSPRPFLAGVNLAGAEFGPWNGVYGTDYIYPFGSGSYAGAAYYKERGMNVIRLPFRWEHIQPRLSGPLDADELARLKAYVQETTALGMAVVLDVHNYARYVVQVGTDPTTGAPRYEDRVVGSAEVPAAAFADLWRRLATAFGNQSGVIFGLMNEPHDMPTDQWRKAANAAIAAIRETGAGQLILVPGNAWSGAHSWQAVNGQEMLLIQDPGNNSAYEVHQYLDADSSGTTRTCARDETGATPASLGVDRISGFTQWLKDHGKRGFLGEFALPNADFDQCQAALTNMLQYIGANRDVWMGWTYWAGGPWWPQDVVELTEPLGGQDRPVMNLLRKYIPAP